MRDFDTPPAVRLQNFHDWIDGKSKIGKVEFRSGPSHSSLLVVVLKGKEIDRWGVDWEGPWMILPYEVSGDDFDVISQSILEQDMPHAWDFFLAPEEKLKRRESGKMRGKDDWYAYIYPKNLTKFDPDKIMTNILSSYNRFVADTEGEYYFVGGAGTPVGTGSSCATSTRLRWRITCTTSPY